MAEEGLVPDAFVPDLERWFASLRASFSERAGFWQSVGRVKALVCQFTLSGAAWYCQVDGDGGRLVEGTHGSAQVEWVSSTEGFLKALKGIQLPDVSIRGDASVLQDFLSALSRAGDVAPGAAR